MTVFKFGRFVLPAAFALAMAGAPAMAQTTGTSAVGAASQGSAAGTAKTSAAQSATAPTAAGAGTGPARARGTGTGASGVAATSRAKSTRLPSGETFRTVAAATAHCPSDTVVWSTLSKSKSYHTSSSKYYGKTKHGAYVCKKDAIAAGFHAAKT